MTILTRYLIRAHIGPFLFSFVVLTGLLFLNAITQRVESLAGRGLTWDIIAEFLALSLPHTIALTFPIAVLVAVLYTLSEMTAANEFTAMIAGGIRPTRILLPLLLVGTALAGLMLVFNDRVLPEANHRLKNLLVDIGNKSPTFQLREQVVNQVETLDGRTRYYLQAATIDRTTNELGDVVIFDVSNPAKHRTIYGDHGEMAFNAARTDLYLTLYDGTVVEVSEDKPGGFQRLAFEKQIIPLRGVADEFERQSGGTHRSDREMPIAMLKTRAAERDHELATVIDESVQRSVRAVREALGLELPPDALGSVGYRDVSERPQLRALLNDDGSLRSLPVDGMTQGVAMNTRTNATRSEILRLTRNRFLVEIHKKYSIAFACIVFVLIGGPLAVRFPRGGVGMVIGVSVAIISVYWMGLIGGEDLADKGNASPFWSMWAANILFLLAGIWMATGMGRNLGGMRGDAWGGVMYRVRGLLRGRGATP